MLALKQTYSLQSRLEKQQHKPSQFNIKRQTILYRVLYQCCSNHLPEWHLQFAYFSKAFNQLSSSGDYKRTRQGALPVLLLYLYKYNMVYATTISTCPKGLMSDYSSTMLLPQGHHAISMCSDIIFFNLHHHAYTMCTP